MSNQILEELTIKIHYDVDKVSLNNYMSTQKKVNHGLMKSTALLRGLGKFVGALGIGVGAVSMVKTYQNLDLIRRSIEGLTQSTQDWDYIQKEAFRTATDIETVAKGYRNFYSAATMAGMDKNSVQTMYSDILEAGRAVGATQPQIQGALLALEQMFSKGKVSMEELRRQLGNALPGAFEVAAKSMGVTTQQFNEMIKKGVQATDLVPKFTAEYRKTFEKSFPASMKSLDAAIVNLSNSWKMFQYDLMNSGAGQELAKGLVAISKFLQSTEAKSVVNALGKGLFLLAKALGLVVKHFRLILLLWGVNQLMKIPALLKMMKLGILDLATSNTKLAFSLNRVTFALANMLFYGGGVTKVMKALRLSLLRVGKAGWALGKSFLWLTVLAGALYTIYLLMQDIFMYLTDPDAITVTGALAEKDEQLKETLMELKKTLEGFKPIFMDLAPLFVQFLNLLIPIMAWLTKISLYISVNFLSAISGIVKAFQNWGDESITLKERLKGVLQGLAAIIGVVVGAIAGFTVGGLPGAIIGGIAGAGIMGGASWAGNSIAKHFGKVPEFTQEDINKQLRFDGMPTTSNMTMLPSQLTKTETNTSSITNNNKIYIDAKNRTDEEMIGLFKSALNGDLDNVNRQINQGVYSSPIPQGS